MLIVLLLLLWPATAWAAVEHEPRTRTLELAGLEAAFGELAETAAPAVVAISYVAEADLPDGREADAAALDAALGRRARVVGTGFCIDEAGYVLTNQHVVAGAEAEGELFVTTDDGRVLPAIVLASDPRNDLAVLKVPAELPAVTFASGGTGRGRWCFTLGNPLGMAGGGTMSLSVGVVAATGRSLPRLARSEDRRYHDLIQVTAEVNPGNSGGPLLDLDGNVVGIVTAVVLPQGEAFGMGFALPADDALLARVGRLTQGLAPRDAALGVTADDAIHGGARVVDGNGVLLAGDVIKAVDGRAVADAGALAVELARHEPGTTATLDLTRDGEAATVEATLAEAPPHRLPAVTADSRRLRWQGVSFAPLPGHWRSAGIARGVLVAAVEPDSPHAETLRVGQVVERVGTLACGDLPSLQRAIFEQDRPAILLSALLP